MKKRIVSLILTAACLISVSGMTACGKNKGPVMSRRTNVYGADELSLPTDIQWINRMAADGDSIYIVYDKQIVVTHYSDGTTEENSGGMEPGIAVPVPAVEAVVEVETEIAVEDIPVEEEFDDDSYYVTYENQTWVYMTNLDGSETASYMLDMPEEAESGYMMSMGLENGRLYMLYELWGEISGFFLYTADAVTGEILRTDDLSGLGRDAGLSEEDYFYISNFVIDNGILYMNVEQKVILYSLADSKTMAVQEVSVVDWINNMYATDGRIYFSGYTENKGQALYTMDLATGETTEVEAENMTYFNMIGTRDQVVCFQDQNGVMGYDPVTGTVSEILNYINCDINSNYVNTILPMSGDRFVYYSSEWDSESGTQTFTLSLLNRIPDEEMQDEILLTIASAYQNYNLRDIVIDFNRQNTGVRLNIKSYDAYDNEENNWTGAVTQLNADITMGNVPDILVLDANLPVESYYSKGVLADLYPYIDNPENGLNRADFLENIFEACEQDGKLYSLIATFYLNTIAANEKYVGTEPGWTMTEMLDVLDSMPEDMIAFYDHGRDYLKNDLMKFCGSIFVDWENGTTNFASEEFIRLMEFLKTCPEKSVMEQFYDNIDYDNYDYEAEMQFYRDYEMRFYNEKALFYTTAVTSLNGYNMIYRTFAGDATLIGYPTADGTGTGAVISPTLELGICAASQNKDSAWVFLQYLLTSEDFFKDAYSFVISRSWLDQKLADSEEYYKDWFYTYTDEEWERMESQYSADYIEYMKKSQIPYTMEQGEKIYDLVCSASRVQRNDKSLMEIIDEELSTFFGGGRSAEETAKIINSRARIYISENS
ncbi:MAG: extracellular solute-binding protein [Clostridia bacterium]|nr:extracellular solute-binding protein [Clostridia bacterium]